MRAVILCPGPSLAALPAAVWPAGAGVIIGVNRAAAYRACGWWAFVDSPVFAAVKPAGLPRVFTTAESLRTLSKGDHRARLMAHAPMALDAAALRFQLSLGWSIYSAPAALCLAAFLGATKIDVYGADW